MKSSNSVAAPLSHTEIAMPTCPLCHTAAETVTTESMQAGAYWSCSRCGQTWDATRLATAAAYARYVASLPPMAGLVPSTS